MGFIGLIRVLILVLALWLIYRFIFHRKPKQLQHDASKPSDPTMVKCEQCETHLPRDDAITNDGLWFCSADHQLEYEQSKAGE
ncbi:MAG: PP0621 family protein [Pseudomonadales bacterium]